MTRVRRSTRVEDLKGLEEKGRKILAIMVSGDSLLEQGRKIKSLNAQIKPETMGALRSILGERLEVSALSKHKDTTEWGLGATLRDGWDAEADSWWENMKAKFREELAQILTPEQFAQFPVEGLLAGMPGFVLYWTVSDVQRWQREEGRLVYRPKKVGRSPSWELFWDNLFKRVCVGS